MDELGMVDMPMRLLMAAVLTSLMVPVVLGAYQDMSMSVAEDRALRDMSRIAWAARSVLDGDAGSTVRIQLELDGFGSSEFIEGTIGGPLDGEERWRAYVIVFELEGAGRITSAGDPPLPMTDDNGGSGLYLLPGRTELEVTHVIVDGIHAASFRKL